MGENKNRENWMRFTSPLNCCQRLVGWSVSRNKAVQKRSYSSLCPGRCASESCRNCTEIISLNFVTQKLKKKSSYLKFFMT